MHEGYNIAIDTRSLCSCKEQNILLPAKYVETIRKAPVGSSLRDLTDCRALRVIEGLHRAADEKTSSFLSAGYESDGETWQRPSEPTNLGRTPGKQPSGVLR